MRPAWIPALLTAAGLAACATDHGPPPAVGAAGLSPCVQRPLGSADEPVIPDLGCANQANLRAMIADPRDLDGGARPTPASGDAAFAAAARHRTGQDKPLSGGESQAQPALVIHDTGGH
ncbi:CpaD family pilus assembly lipoprotein [Phenylobacterium sp.]|uniref:CpaD family pilus assembly lipoprotein n=1 Tax=Phenylobacterium sp. TaxID=1871053 RepID=UPI002DF6171D|nr:CpaD family pilus assembly lipoprotein [Phenylobacterium sp.]